MKSKIELNVTVDDEQWTENTDFDAVKVAEELRDLAFAYVAAVSYTHLDVYKRQGYGDGRRYGTASG